MLVLTLCRVYCPQVQPTTYRIFEENGRMIQKYNYFEAVLFVLNILNQCESLVATHLIRKKERT